MTVNLYNLLILVGAIHGLLLSVLLLLSKRNRRSSNVLLALLLALYTLPLLKSVLQDLGVIHRLWNWPLELLYGLGPSLYLYAKTVTDHGYRLRRSDLVHFLPVLLELSYYLGPLYRGPTRYGFTPVEDPPHLIWMVQQVGGVSSVLIYLVLTNRLLLGYARWVQENYADNHRRTLRWLRVPVGLYTLFFGLWFGLRAVDVVWFSDRLEGMPYYPLLLFLSFSTYWIGTRGFLEAQAPTRGFQQAERSAAHHAVGAEQAQHAPDPVLATVFQELEARMAEEKIYRENDLRLTDLAERLAVNPRLLSRAINAEAKMNFYDFVNRYRVEDFKRRVAEPGPRRTLLDLAHDCGFGSKATFNAVFKKATGVTPSQYRKRVQRPAAPAASGADRGAPGR